MIKVSAAALHAAILLSCSAGLVAAAHAQSGAPAAGEAPRTFNLTKGDRAALNPLVAAIRAGNYAAAQAALPAARSGVSSADARYLVAAEQFRLGVATNNRQLQGEAIDAMLASGLAPAAEVPELLLNQASLAVSAGSWDKAEASLNRLLQLQPANPEALAAMATFKTIDRDYASTVNLVHRLVEQYRAAGRPISEGVYKYGLNYATMTAMTPQAMEFARGLIANYPSPQNWRDVLLTYRDMARPDGSAELDVWRLLRASKALAGERDYLSFAAMLNRADLPGEAKEVLEEGVAAKMIDPADSEASQLRRTVTTKAAQETKALAAEEKAALAAATGADALAAADSYFGRADYAKAASLYQAALLKGGVDPNLVNTRLGLALAMAGQKAPAESALRAVTGPRGDLAAFALLLAAQRG